ncbi:hypothetical protein [Novacetimonas cocois]|uniref:hypothetical protein n=1 Tax=Novacetimonas cocois TaxID=1747507 RepID=UPI001057E0B4|nr:hypothetical protein [Novacetimonas cocois]
MDHGCKGSVCPVASQGDANELVELAEEVLDRMARFEQDSSGWVSVKAIPALGNDHAGTLRAYGIHDPVNVECPVDDALLKSAGSGKGSSPDRIVIRAGEARQVAQGIRQHKTIHAGFEPKQGASENIIPNRSWEKLHQKPPYDCGMSQTQSFSWP